MLYVFKKHYSLEEARALLPRVREWLHRLAALRQEMARQEEALTAILEAGHDAGGALVNGRTRAMAECLELLSAFDSLQIQVKDIERGLIDFPAIIGGREVFLCWEHGEADIAYWHDLQAGYAGREKL